MRQSGAESRCWGLEIGCAYPGWGLLQLDPHMGLSVLVHKLHQLLSIITPDQHYWPSQPQGLLQLQEGKCPQGLLCSDFFPWYLCFPSPSPLLKHPNIPGYLLSSSSILSDVKEDGTGSSLTCHPGLQRHMAEVPLGSEKDTAQLCPSLTSSHTLPVLGSCAYRTSAHTYIPHVRSQ